MAKPYYETADRTMERRAQGRFVDYLQRRFDEEKRKNPNVEGMTYNKKQGIVFRYAPDKKATQALELLKTKLWWAKHRAAPDKKPTQTPEWQETKLWWAKHGVFF